MFMVEREELDFDKMFEKCDNILSKESCLRNSDGTFDINLSTPLTILIQTAGRYCDSYASDLFISWEEIIKLVRTPPDDGNDKLFIFGFRRNGVDHDIFVRKSSNRYRKIFAARLTCKQEENSEYDRLTFILKDITNNCIGITD